MLELTLAAAGLAAGAAITWLVLRGQGPAAVAAVREPLLARVAGLETVQDELRKQLTERELEISALRSSLDLERTQRAQAETRWEAARESAAEQARLLEAARERLADTFRALSADALRQSNTSFLELAREALDTQLGRRQEAIEGLVRPLQDALHRAEEQVRTLERAREHAYGSLEHQLRALAVTSDELRRETGSLVSALRSPHVRGRWGEITLRRVVELAGMAERCDFEEQPTLETESGRLRPDLVVRLPAGREIVVDSKVPLSAYLDAMAAATPAERQAALARHAQQVRAHMLQLAGKSYWEQFAQSPELVVMFIPLESFVAAAAEADASLIEDGLARRVVIATPTTLVALLLAVAYGWRQQQIAANATEISELGKQVYERLRLLGEHFEAVGTSLGRAMTAYNQAVGSLESRVLPAARRFRDLGAAGGKEIETLQPLDQRARPLTAPEFPTQLDTSDLPA
jgi:DNA recombination protein RmuC